MRVDQRAAGNSQAKGRGYIEYTSAGVLLDSRKGRQSIVSRSIKKYATVSREIYDQHGVSATILPTGTCGFFLTISKEEGQPSLRNGASHRTRRILLLAEYLFNLLPSEPWSSCRAHSKSSHCISYASVQRLWHATKQ